VSASSMDAPALEAWLQAAVAARLGQAPEAVDPELPFQALGLDSQAVVELSGELEELLGRSLDPTLLFEFPTIRRLAAHLAEPPP